MFGFWKKKCIQDDCSKTSLVMLFRDVANVAMRFMEKKNFGQLVDSKHEYKSRLVRHLFVRSTKALRYLWIASSYTYAASIIFKYSIQSQEWLIPETVYNSWQLFSLATQFGIV